MNKIPLHQFLKIDNNSLFNEYLNEDKDEYEKLYCNYFPQEMRELCSKRKMYTMSSYCIYEFGIQIFIDLYPKVEAWLLAIYDIQNDIDRLRNNANFRKILKLVMHLEKTLPPHP